MKMLIDRCVHTAADFSLRRFLALGACLLLASGAFAQGFLDLPPGKWWKNDELVHALRLSPDQQKRLEEVMYRHLEEMIDLKAGFEKEELRLRQMVDLPKVDEKQLLEQARRAIEAQTRMQMNRAALFVKVRALLSPEQWEKIKIRFQQERRERRYQERRERREGRGPGAQEPLPEPRPEAEGGM